VVDDDNTIADMLGKFLGSLGYEVNTFTDPSLVPDADLRDTDLLIADMAMPGMTGLALAETVGRINPGLPVILMTGFSEAIDPELAREKGIREMLFKPVGSADIAAAIRRTLDTLKTQ